jgi:hypothetical protein
MMLSRLPVMRTSGLGLETGNRVVLPADCELSEIKGIASPDGRCQCRNVKWRAADQTGRPLMRSGRVVGVAVALVVFSAGVFGQSKHLAPGFEHLPKEAKVVLMPADIELFSISAGGVLEPKADWTEAAGRHFRAALLERQRKLGLGTIELSEDRADERG